MNSFSRIFFAFFLLVSGLALSAQQVSDLRINEILIKNDSNYVDEYGRHVPWVEIFNAAYNSVNLAECYLTDDTSGLADGSGVSHWYRIPEGDPKTLLEQRSSVVFFMDNSPLYGTFHVNFDLKTSRTNYVALIDYNGNTLIDMMYYPVELRDSSVSYGCLEDGVAKIEKQGKTVPNVDYLGCFTPGSTNNVVKELSKAEAFQKEDPYGLGLAVIAMSVVFAALILIFVMLKLFSRVARVKEAVKDKKNMKTVDGQSRQGQIPEEEVAAVAMALHLHFNSRHDVESGVLTFADSSALHSPWAQRNLTMRRLPRMR